MSEEPTLTQEELLLEPESPRSVLDNDFFDESCSESPVYIGVSGPL